MMDDEDFKGIVSGLGDAIAFAKGDKSRARVVAGIDVKAVRKSTKLTQSAFSRTYRIPLGTLRDWEQFRRVPDAPSQVLLSLIASAPKEVERMVENAKDALPLVSA